MRSLKNLKIGKLVSCRINDRPAVLKKLNERADGLIAFEIVRPRNLEGQIHLLDGNLRAEPSDVIIKHKGYTLDDRI